MKRYFLFLTLIGFFILILVPHITMAGEGDHALFCADAADTSQTITCINKELAYHQNTLNELFESALSNSASDDEKNQLKDIQNKWLTYRDAECSREKSWRSGEALARVYELSCLSQLTESRIERLKREEEAKDQDTLPEFTPFPRWQTASMQNYPEIYWNFAKSFAVDGNCDGIKDQITPGIKFSPASTNDTAASNVTQSPVFSIALLKETGRADLHVFESNQFRQECLSSYVITSHEIVGESCNIYIEFENKTCPELAISWDANNNLYKELPKPTEAPNLTPDATVTP